jgi:hypothetical protein
MRPIQESQVRRWMQIPGGRKAPAAISAFCPHCQEQVVFELKDASTDGRRQCSSFSATCPSCAQSVAFFVLSSKDRPDVFMYPSGPPRPTPKDFGDLVPEPLRRSYESAVLSFASKNYVATSVCARRTLEGIFKYALPADQQQPNLAKAIDKVKETRDLSKPLTTLSHAIRQGGNLGAHFDPNHEPTAELASKMVELLEYLIEYLYTLPGEIGRLEEALASTPPDTFST